MCAMALIAATLAPVTSWPRCPVSPASCSWGACSLPGTGTATMADGTTASGTWRGGLLEGGGRLARGDGAEVRGHFARGCLEGLVTVEEAGGALLVGAYRGGVVAGGPVWLLLAAGEGAVYTRARGGYGHLTRCLTPSHSPRTQGPAHRGGGELPLPRHGHRPQGALRGRHHAEHRSDRTPVVGRISVCFILTTGVAAVTQRRLLSDGMLEVEVGEVAAPRGAPEEFTSDPSTSTHLSSSPLQRDPYEAQLVAVRRSSIPGAGVGVFTTAPVTAGTIIAYFNGVHKHKKDVFSEAERSEYLAEGAHHNEMLDIPEEFRSWSSYQASAGHLINHGAEGNVEYVDCWHPRYPTTATLGPGLGGSSA